MFVLFDFDGPIVDLFDRSAGLSATLEVLRIGAAFGVGSAGLETNSMFLEVWGKLRAEVRKAHGQEERFDQLVHQALERIEKALVRSRPASLDCVDMMSTVRLLAAGIAVVSNNSAEAIRDWLSLNGLVHLVDCVSARTGKHTYQNLKPEPDLLVEAIAQLGCRPDRALFFGDSLSDYVCARRVGVNFVGFRTPPLAQLDGVFSTSSRSDIVRYVHSIVKA